MGNDRLPPQARDADYGFAEGVETANGLRSAARDNNDYAWAGHYAVNRNYITNGLNRYTAAGGAGFGYDPNGNLTSDGTRGFEYNAENRLTVGYAGAAHQELIDDARDRLFRYYDGTANRWLLYDGTALIAEVDGNGTTLRRYVHGPGEDDPLVWYEGAGTNDRHWLHADAQGSIVALSDASGALTAINRYDEYGIPAAGNVGRFQYTGQAFLPELGMYYYKARIYSPTLGRFMQTDPIGYDDQFNLYEYVGDDPVNATDPSGTAGVLAWVRDVVRDPDTYIAAAEVVVSGHMIGTGGAGLAASIVVEGGSLGLASPAALPAAAVSAAVVVTGAAIGVDAMRRFSGVLQRAGRGGDPNARDQDRVRDQRQLRNERREARSRQGPNGNGQNLKGNNPARAQGRAEAHRGPAGERPRGPDRRFNRERSRGIDEEHNMRPPGQQGN